MIISLDVKNIFINDFLIFVRMSSVTPIFFQTNNKKEENVDEVVVIMRSWHNLSFLHEYKTKMVDSVKQLNVNISLMQGVSMVQWQGRVFKSCHLQNEM